MPRSFPTMDSLKSAGKSWKFREPNEGETEAEYRVALADHVKPKDLVESMEIRTGVGWNQFTPEQNKEMLRRG